MFIDSKTAIELQFIADALPPKGRLTLLNKKQWKYSIQEAIDSIIIHAKNPGNIERLMQHQKDAASSKNQQVQPYILVEGKNIREIKNFYVIIDAIRVKTKSLVQALDICFKAFFVLKAKYPVQSEHIWLLIQRGVYNIITFHDKTFPSIVDVLGAVCEL